MKLVEGIEKVFVPVIVIVGGVIIIQAHAIPYWQNLMGLRVGLLASLQAELIAMYLVYQPGRMPQAIGFTLVAVMVLVPAWVICEPEYAAWREAERAIEQTASRQAQASALLPMLEIDIASKEASLREDEAKSRVRSGWLVELQRQRGALESLREQRRSLVALQATSAPPIYDVWSALPKVVPVLMLFVVLQLAITYAIRCISGFRHRLGERVGRDGSDSIPDSTTKNDSRLLSESPVGSDSLHSAELPHPARVLRHGDSNGDSASAPRNLKEDGVLVRRLQKVVADEIKQLGSGRRFLAKYEVNPRDLNYLMKHFERKRSGSPMISANMLANLARMFLDGEQAEA